MNNFSVMARDEESILRAIERQRRNKGLLADTRGTFYHQEVEAIQTRISLYRMLAEEETRASLTKGGK